MRITVRNLLIFVACVGVALGQARLPVFVGTVCLMPEILLLGRLIPFRLSFWLSGGIFLGILLGVVVWAVSMRWIEFNPANFPTIDEARSHLADQIAQIGRFGPYCIQVGALMGGTAGLILGQVRFPHKRRTFVAPPRRIYIERTDTMTRAGRCGG